MTAIESKRGTFALMVDHCAGMLDLIALPLWVGTLIARYNFDPRQAGGAATLFLIGASAASIFFAPRFSKMKPKWAVVVGFALAAIAFAICSQQTSFVVLAPLHLLGGLAAGTALSFTHGTIGHAKNPHRMFAIAGLAIGILGIVFLGGTPGLINRFGGSALFYAFAGIMVTATFVSLFFFPSPARRVSSDDGWEEPRLPPLSREVWFSIFAVALLAMAQAMTLSFYERIGMARGFGRELVTIALMTYGIVTLFPAPLAGLLEKRLSPIAVISTVPVLQAVFALIVTHTTNYALFAAAGSLMAFTILFVHTFAFGLLSRLDPTGRAVAGTPAMLMSGAAIAPFLGGMLVHFFGFEAVGYAAVVLVAIELFLFNQTRRIIQSRNRARNSVGGGSGVQP